MHLIGCQKFELRGPGSLVVIIKIIVVTGARVYCCGQKYYKKLKLETNYRLSLSLFLTLVAFQLGGGPSAPPPLGYAYGCLYFQVLESYTENLLR